MIIAGLQPETAYSITVAAYTMKGDGARSKPKLAMTKGAGKSLAARLCVCSGRKSNQILLSLIATEMPGWKGTSCLNPAGSP